MNNDKENNEANEPAAEYNVGKKMYFFKSFEEMEEHDAKEMADRSPLQHLQDTTDLIKRVFAKELQKKFSDYTIHFKEPWK